MALSGRLTGRTSTLFRQCRAATSTPRSFSTRTSTRSLLSKVQRPAAKSAQYQIRLFSSSIPRADQKEASPSAKAYLESGVVKKAANPVDLKKVLVIGSGGLSIGQAGEFDYSGWSL
jgi:carbamoyl-phosphate synthase large subunit